LSESVSRPVLEVLYPGVLTSLQDLGRKGYQSLGIAEAGAMDTWSLVAANRLVDNHDNAAALEITVVGPKLRFLAPTRFSLTGADLSARLDQEPIQPGGSHGAGPGQELSFGRRLRGFRAYLAVKGGFDAPLVLGSRSTYLYAGFGGLDGRALAAGDTLTCPAPGYDRDSPDLLPPAFLLPEDGPRVIRVIMGPHEDRFTPESIAIFLESPYTVTPESNRMGYRLEGPRLEHVESPIVVSESTPLGAVQVPGQGTPVLLLRERGTTGGYTKIACIITPDIDVIGQTPPGADIRFRAVELTEAHRAEKERWMAMNAWKTPRPE